MTEDGRKHQVGLEQAVREGFGPERQRWPTPNAMDAAITPSMTGDPERQLRRGDKDGSRRNTTGSLAKDLMLGISPSTSSAEGSPASRSAWPGRGGALLTRGGSGPSSLDSFAYFDPATCSWRTSQGSLLEEAWERFSETWPRAGTMRSGTAFRRRPSVPLTSVTASSSLPTPAAHSYGTNQGGGMGRTGPVRLGLEQMALQDRWPTPQARDGDGRGPQAKRFADPRRSYNLDDAVAARWPTPTSTLGDHGGLVTPDKAREGGTLIEAVSNQLWPTPTQQDSRGSGSADYSTESGRHSGTTLTDAVKRWPTPTSALSVSGQDQKRATRRKGGRVKGTGDDLATAVSRWPTPHGFSPDGLSNGPSGNELGRAVNQSLLPTPQARDWKSGTGTETSHGKHSPPLSSAIGGQLNPTWVEWLMGFPLGWTVLEPSETPSFRRSPRRSGG